MKGKCDFSGYATRYDTRCSDGRTIRRGAFKDMDGKEIPIVWNHNHGDPSAVVGKGILHSVRDGLRVDGWFTNTQAANDAHENLMEGVPMTLSIHATNLKQRGTEVAHGIIREVSLVLAGANPGAVIDHVALAHSLGGYTEDEALINWEEPVILHSYDDEDDEDEDFDEDEYDDDDEDLEDDDEYDDEDSDEDEEDEDEYDDDDEDLEDDEEDDEMEHSYSETTRQEIINSMDDLQRHVMFGLVSLADTNPSELSHAAEEIDMDDIDIDDVLDSMDDQQLALTYLMVEEASSGDDDDDEEYDEEYDEEEEVEMKHNVFDTDLRNEKFEISLDDQKAILEHAMESNCGSFQTALKEYFAEQGVDSDELMHGFNDDDMEYLFPDFKDPKGDGEPWTLTRDMTWVDDIINGAHKTPFSRIKTRYIDATGTGIRARGYKKGDKKELIADVEVLHRETTPQTIYVKDELDRDDKVDFTEFGIVAYINKIMTMTLKEEAAIAILFGDGRDNNDKNKIKEDHIRPIWTDNEAYTIHATIDLDATRSKLQGSNTGMYFGDSYIWAESFVETSLYTREQYKGSGNLTMYCTPHTRNVMLLARDRNGRRIYDTVNELAAALDVKKIVTVEQMAGLTRTVVETVDNEEVTKTKKLLAIFVNMTDYNIGATKGGEITSFEQFDIDFNKEKFLKEARFSGALTKIKSAIVIEEDVVEESEVEEQPAG